jgi:monovalent cation/hydrogen antiporter
MESLAIHNVELVILLLLLFVAALAAVAKRFHTPYPIVLVVGGLLISFVPHGPRVELSPDIVFLVILPPLLFAAAFHTSWRDFRYNLVSISMLAFGLVAFTVVGVAAAARWILPGFDWRTGLVLGAVVCTTDAIAATSIAQRIGLPKRIVDILEGESLVNDASGLVALEFAVALVVSGQTPTFIQGAGRLLYLISTSIVIGLLVGKLGHFVLARIEDAAIEITLILIAPYIAYLSAEGVRSSGVLAVIACGLYLGHKSSLYFSRSARLRSGSFWDTLTFILNGLVFILIGLQLPYVLDAIRDLSLSRLLAVGLIFSAFLIALRLLWIYPGAFVGNLIRRRLQHQAEALPSSRAVFLVGWTGMRGVVALAAAISLPKVLEDGQPFPQRDVMIFLTFCVIFVTLVLQGLTLPALIRRLGLALGSGKNPEELEARRAITQAALAYLEEARNSASEQLAPVYDDMIRHHRSRLSFLQAEGASSDSRDDAARRQEYDHLREISSNVRSVERAALLLLRDQHLISDEILRTLEREIDLTDARLASSEYL